MRMGASTRLHAVFFLVLCCELTGAEIESTIPKTLSFESPASVAELADLRFTVSAPDALQHLLKPSGAKFGTKAVLRSPVSLLQKTSPSNSAGTVVTVQPLSTPDQPLMQFGKHEAPYLAKEVELLHAQIEATHATEAALDSENESLRRELAGWKTAGGRVAQREKHIVSMIRQLRDDTPAGSTGTPVSLLQHQVLSSTMNSLHREGKLRLEVFVVSAICCAAFLGFWYSPSQTFASNQNALSRGDWTRCIKPVLRQAGFGRYILEISELQVSVPGLPVNTDVSVALQTNDRKSLRTKSAEVLEGSPLLNYHDTFHVDLRRSDGPCIFTVVGSGQRFVAAPAPFALLELTAAEMLRIAHKDRSEYFRFDLELLPGACNRSESIDRPYVAMRIQDVTYQAPRVPPQV